MRSLRGEFGADGEAALGARAGAQPAAEGGDPFAHAEQPDPGHRARVRAAAVAVVVDLHGQRSSGP